MLLNRIRILSLQLSPADSVQAQPSRGEQAAPLIDAHIHLDAYDHAQQRDMLSGLPSCLSIAGVITVSMHLESARSNLRLARQYPSLVYPAFGYHPEQPVPAPSDVDELLAWMRRHADDMVAVGEVGLPYYTRKEAEEEGTSRSTANLTRSCWNGLSPSPRNMTSRWCFMRYTRMPTPPAVCLNGTA